MHANTNTAEVLRACDTLRAHVGAYHRRVRRLDPGRRNVQTHPDWVHGLVPISLSITASLRSLENIFGLQRLRWWTFPWAFSRTHGPLTRVQRLQLAMFERRPRTRQPAWPTPDARWPPRLALFLPLTAQLLPPPLPPNDWLPDPPPSPPGVDCLVVPLPEWFGRGRCPSAVEYDGASFLNRWSTLPPATTDPSAGAKRAYADTRPAIATPTRGVLAKFRSPDPPAPRLKARRLFESPAATASPSLAFAPRVIGGLAFPPRPAVNNHNTSALAQEGRTYARARAMAMTEGDHDMAFRADLARVIAISEAIEEDVSFGVNANTFKKD